jgi:hypothetical protein
MGEWEKRHYFSIIEQRISDVEGGKSNNAGAEGLFCIQL